MELDIRGTAADVLVGYLKVLGGTESEPGIVRGPGWSAALSEGVHRFAHWEMPRVVVRFAGDPGSVAEVVRRFRIMAWRGGG